MTDMTDNQVPEPPTSKKVWKILVWLASLLGAALITGFVKDYWEAPRPILQITGFEFRSAEGGEAEASLEAQLVKQVANHPYLPNMDFPITIGDLKKKTKQYNRLYQQWADAEALVGRLIALLKSQGTAISVEKRRGDFIQMLADDSDVGNLIDGAAKFYIEKFEPNLDPKYQHHPVGSENLHIELRSGSYDLSQINEQALADATTIRRMDAHRTNLYRRILIYYDPDFLVSFFTRLNDSITSNNREAARLIDELEQSGAGKKTRRHIMLDVLVSNRGQRPIGIRGIGVVRLEVPPTRDGGSVAVLIPVINASDADAMILVDGGKASTIHLQSRDNIEQIVQANGALLGGEGWSAAKSLDDSRFLLLFKAKTGELKASVALIRAGAEPKSAKVGPSASVPVSQSATERAIDEITNSLR